MSIRGEDRATEDVGACKLRFWSELLITFIWGERTVLSRTQLLSHYVRCPSSNGSTSMSTLSEMRSPNGANGIIADHVERELAGAVISAVNRSEVVQRVRSQGADWEIKRAALLSYGLTIESVTASGAEAAALLWRSDSGLSIADRLRLALGSGSTYPF